jgi:integrase
VPRKPKIILDYGIDHGEEWERLYSAFQPNWRLFFLICYETGMRPIEVSKMESTWINERGGSYIIEIPADQEKTGFTDRRIPVSKILEPQITGISGQLFEHHDYFKAFNQARDKAGLRPDVTAYALRRTRATIWDAIDPGAARVALGHVPADVHEENYVQIPDSRLFKLVGIETRPMQIFKSG